ncbi:tRNA (adenosine(37)-N6)-threonylcarbamoyltransferase complex dimerization subunit type 1 TsaB [Bacillus hominis]|uniref:tRNA (Adenosine(37)-N6)-threonylcarbamoyltransferase complex dimerization subunit type 1 TsaB n=1 Tax=Bacillus hominis TaxID=2817478 RepID=A0ABT7R1Y4_9BACI|nr:tRNA (adenosine(37)-N6)-threonylcarbamoyltransferase complex dimerization subunit type 1 TsaB [Bacillus hominis]MDM5191769.1 tRNA (adenosine(37)-N6)-threonylcarbamoyltransferase complex dimerization subunit type 1 TsaB [Bacillus hominis]MDM5431500.1 tRNA (adenosine(37)-N6)-threonylcarbamoyltransferase complex dimerization subunit type 1 TsaB [Bacillus hominis]MDM5436936.1 tRNA (adenosine(37)-N6)-threonylcarbamoyltransferase complex dimerization subunit type 1 TsaB [Bacillus hominis]
MKVLAIDTSNYVMGVSLIEEGNVIGEIITNLTKNHSVRLMPAVEKLLKECGVKPKELTKIVVAAGPGSYTGVRIGVTAAKTLAWSLQIPIVGVSSLEVVAANGANFNGLICPLFDGRRGQIYTGLYTYEGERITSIEEDRIILIVDWLQMLKDKGQPVLFIGNDVKLHKETIVEYLGDQAVFAPFTKNNPRPSELAFLGLQKEEQDVHTFVPSYLRLAEAETKWLESQKK